MGAKKKKKEEEKGKCFNCQADVDGICYGCRSFVCEACDVAGASVPWGGHAKEAHLEEHFEDDE
jgi:hypothetical protein